MPRIYTKKSPEERFWVKVKWQTPTEKGCWLWTAAIADTGYGIFNNGDKLESAHRWAYRWAYGEIPEDSDVIMHTCDVRNCVNPEHLVAGTYTDNVVDMDSKGRRVTLIRLGEAASHVKLTDDQVKNIREEAKSGVRGVQARLARRYKISASNITDIIHRRIWKHLI